MIDWIKVVRPTSIFAAGLFSVVGFRISEWNNLAILVVIFTVFVGSAIMTHNDWRDRFHDKQKGKTFALEHCKIFPNLVIFLWTCAAAWAAFLLEVNYLFGILSFGIIITGLIYSEILKIPFVPNFVVAMTNASLVLYSIIFSPSKAGWLLFAAIMFFILAKEILKDLDDFDIDEGHKWTWPLQIGVKRSKILSGIFFLISYGCLVGISLKALIGAPLFIITSIMLIANQNYKFAKKIGDGGILICLVLFLF